jgi:small subunit ribosomal protein S17
METNNKQTLIGEVISDKMDKTIVVKIYRTYLHPKFKKAVRTLKKYKVHDEAEVAKIGDMVEIFEGKPTSKTKYMYLSKIVKSA